MIGRHRQCGNEIYAPGLRRLYYDARGRVSSIDLVNGGTIDLRYGPDGALLHRLEEASNGATLRSTFYIGNAEIVIKGSDSIDIADELP